MRLRKDDETLLEVEGQITDGAAGKMSFVLVPEDSALLQAKDAQTIEVELGYDNDALNRILQFENALVVKEALE